MTLEDDEQAVSPVIATILMVAITVVLSGVIYVWASSLADTSAKGVPRITFTLDSSQAAEDNGFHRITVTGSQVELATQAIQVIFEYKDQCYWRGNQDNLQPSRPNCLWILSWKL